ncbi:hypothetical protein JNB_16599 [Janibacter sp. HTCC2649]|uniref:hypothetical protein n=1 Tax=Janibacter sp. HTCC2649 TaxID=313589 RepID=UPI00006711E0|nr:hypothetical protein [Janibacter sp. HTCC2649]EAP97123.1 hypothetical protein JNB_16599 [Janibacter sp. HTCC2649]
MTDNLVLALQGGWKVLVVALVLGAGLPSVFAVGIRSLAWGTGGSAEVDVAARPHPAGRAVAFACFAVVLIGIGLGISIVVASGFGQSVSFEHIYPTFVPKK